MTQAASQIEISINGEQRQVPSSSTVSALLRDLRVDPRHVAVERNRHLVLKTDYEQEILQAGDHLEIVTFVGGG